VTGMANPHKLQLSPSCYFVLRPGIRFVRAFVVTPNQLLHRLLRLASLNSFRVPGRLKWEEFMTCGVCKPKLPSLVPGSRDSNDEIVKFEVVLEFPNSFSFS
jgi:hypothetical protein